MAELRSFDQNITAPRLKNWFRDDAPLSEWEGITSNDNNEVVGIDLITVDPDLTARHRIDTLEHLSFNKFHRLPQHYLHQLAKDYASNEDLCLDFRGVVGLDDAGLKVFAEAGVRWQKMDLGGTAVTEAGFHVLSGCPKLLVK